MFEEDTEAVLVRWIANRCHWTSFPKTLDYRLGFRVVHPEERSSRLAPLGLVLPQRQADKHRGKGHLARLTRTQRGSWEISTWRQSRLLDPLANVRKNDR
jgi:hypothetical protein